MKTALAVALIIVIIVGVFYLMSRPKGGSIELDSVEVLNYNGTLLSSVYDFRENSIRGPQYIDTETYNLQVTGLVENPKEYTYDELVEQKQSYKQVVTLFCVEGWDVKILWEGFLIKDLLDDVKPKENANTIIFYAYDGYSTSFPLDYVKNNDIIIAYKINNVTIPPERGFPFQLVAQSKWGYKWIKWITKIELSDNSDYRGYWETFGYNNDGSLSGPKFE